MFGNVRVYNPNSWITIPMTRIVGKIYKNTKENKENKGAAFGRAPQGHSAPLWLQVTFAGVREVG